MALNSENSSPVLQVAWILTGDSTAYLLCGGSIYWKPFKGDSSWAAELVDVSTSLGEGRENGASGKEEVTSPAEAQSALPPCWAMGTHACRCARVATDVESETGQTQGF